MMNNELLLAILNQAINIEKSVADVAREFGFPATEEFWLEQYEPLLQLKRQLSQRQMDKDELTLDHPNLESSAPFPVEEAEPIIVEVEADTTHLDEQIQTLQQQNIELLEERETLKAKITNAAHLVVRKDKEIERLLNQIDEYEEEEGDTVAEHHEAGVYKAKISALEKEIEQLKGQGETQENTGLTSALKEQIQYLNKQLGIKEELICRLDEKNCELKEQLESMEY